MNSAPIDIQFERGMRILARFIARKIILEGSVGNSKNGNAKEISPFPVGLLTVRNENTDLKLEGTKIEGDFE